MADTLSDVVGLVDPVKWGRRWNIVALLALEDTPRPLVPRDFRTELGRTTNGEIRYDRQLLERLVEEHVLYHWPPTGSLPGLWLVNRDIRRWQGPAKRDRRGRVIEDAPRAPIPWVGRGRAAAMAFAARRGVVEGTSSDVFPAQRVRGGDVRGRFSERFEALTSVVEHHQRDPQVHQTYVRIVSDLLEHAFELHQTGVRRAGDTMPLTRLLSEDSSSSNHDDDELIEQRRAIRRQVADTVKSYVGLVFATPRRALDEWVDAQAFEQRPDELARLLAWIRTFRAQGIKSPPAAVQHIVEHGDEALAGNATTPAKDPPHPESCACGGQGWIYVEGGVIRCEGPSSGQSAPVG